MEFHGTFLGKLEVTWDSMELEVLLLKFHVIPWNHKWNSMELGVCQFRCHEQFHGIPWNLECANFADTNGSGALQVPWNSLSTALVSEICALQIPWNSVELLVSAKLAHAKFHGIPWSCSCIIRYEGMASCIGISPFYTFQSLQRLCLQVFPISLSFAQ